MKRLLILGGLLCLGVDLTRGDAPRSAARPAQPLPATEPINFDRDVRPIFSNICFKCHGPDPKARKAKLRLDVRTDAIRRGAFVPGKPDDSELVTRVFATDPETRMPPPKSNKKLTTEQKEILKRWVAEGAKYAPHWAYTPLQRPLLPAVKNTAWVRNPIDRFILHKLEARGIAPSAEADRRTLLRRLSLDLIGLPPTPAEVRAFVEDNDPRAYERVVERLLAEPAYGERMAVAWLDLARFADTVGYHGDQNQHVFPYRDYVINAFNTNKPFDQFTIEQLAGDLLPHPTPEQRVATGFNRLNMVTREGGAQPKEYLAKYAADRVRTVATTWLGSTMGCCECHDHKFDPFRTKDFYQLAAFFADVKQWGVYADYGYTPNPDLKGFTNDHPFPPELRVTSEYLQQRERKYRRYIADLLDTAGAKVIAGAGGQAAFAAWRQESLAFLETWPDGWAVLRPTRIELGSKLLSRGKPTTKPGSMKSAVEADGRVLFTGSGAVAARLQLQPPAGRLAAIRLELLPHTKHGNSITRGGQATTVQMSAALHSRKTGKEVSLSFREADANFKEPRYRDGDEVIGIRTGWRTAARHAKEPHVSVWLLDAPVQVGKGDTLVVRLSGGTAGCARVAVSPFAGDRPLLGDWRKELLPTLRETGSAASPVTRSLLRGTYLLSTAVDGAVFTHYKELEQEVLQCRGGLADTLVTVAAKPLLARILPRGNWQDETGAVVEPATPHFLPPFLNPKERRLTRLDLARWLVARDNPLTARVFVNRLWKEFFGTGLSAVVDDLGYQGEWPSHPALLDWLAVEFRDRGWNVKHLVKLLVMSAAYRQDSKRRPELEEIDPANRLLAAQNPRRLEAEFVRDNALAIAGLLNRDVGGPSVFPYQPSGYYRNLQFPDRDYNPDRDDRQYRRGVYMHWQRTFLHPMLANFDAPSREECTAARTVANTPQQALTLLNDPTFTEAARVFGQHLLQAAASDTERLDRAYQRALARPAQDKEKRSLARFLAEQRAHYRQHETEARQLLHVGLAPAPANVDAVELAAWTNVCRVILNLSETITRY